MQPPTRTRSSQRARRGKIHGASLAPPGAHWGSTLFSVQSWPGDPGEGRCCALLGLSLNDVCFFQTTAIIHVQFREIKGRSDSFHRDTRSLGGPRCVCARRHFRLMPAGRKSKHWSGSSSKAADFYCAFYCFRITNILLLRAVLLKNGSSLILIRALYDCSSRTRDMLFGQRSCSWEFASILWRDERIYLFNFIFQLYR